MRESKGERERVRERESERERERERARERENSEKSDISPEMVNIIQILQQTKSVNIVIRIRRRRFIG